MRLPTHQKAVIFYQHSGPLEYKTIPVPTPSDSEILVNIKYSGVCHSDLHAWKGYWPEETILPLVGGHEGAGIVVAKGSKVDNFQIGDFAGVKWINKTCLNCEFCIKGEETCCLNQTISGYTVQGTFQQYVVADSIQAAKISKKTDLSKVAPVLCAGLTAYKALKKANLKQGQWVAIIGAGGGLGSFAVQYANAMGFRVIAIDSGSKKAYIEDKLKAEVFVDFTKSKDLIQEINDLTDGGAHGVINFSVSVKAMNIGVEYVRTLGTFVIVGMPPNAVIQSDVYKHVTKQFNLTASSVGNRKDTIEALDFFERGLINTPVQIFGLTQLQEVYALMEKNQLQGRAVVDTSR